MIQTIMIFVVLIFGLLIVLFREVRNWFFGSDEPGIRDHSKDKGFPYSRRKRK